MSTNRPPLRIAALHDLSCFGRCALTVIIPTLSAMGYQVVPVPTALLSTHTGGFTDLHFRDLTADMTRISEHFSRLSLSFDALYTGFLGSAEQIDCVIGILEQFGTEAEHKPLILVDPVIGDDGEPYSTYTPELIRGMKRVSRHAQILTPNLTEACFLTDTPYQNTALFPIEQALAFAESLLQSLRSEYGALTVITGISLCDGRVANLGVDENGRQFLVCRQNQAVSYPGTGDLFASVLLGDYLTHRSFARATETAADFIGEVIAYSAGIDTPQREGVALEPLLWKLTPHHD